MARTPAKKLTKSPRSRSTRRSSASTPTSSVNAAVRKSKHQKLAAELLARSLHRESPKKIQEAVVEGVSMWPSLRPGYRVLYRAVDPETLSPGDVLVLRSLDRAGRAHWRVHRLLGRVGPYFVEAGDNTYVAALVRPGDILGRVEKAKDWNG